MGEVYPTPAGGPRTSSRKLVEGVDLAERLKRGPVPVDEALAVAKQIAEALAEAQEHGNWTGTVGLDR